MKNLKLGLDSSSIGYFVLMDKNKILCVCQVPQKLNIHKEEIKVLEQKIKDIEPELEVKGRKGKTEDIIKGLKREIVRYKDNDILDVDRVHKWLEESKDFVKVCNIEKPLLQSNTPTSIISLTKMSEYLGIAITLLDSHSIPRNIISIQDWRSNFNYVKPPKDCKNKREFTKQESIRIVEEQVINIEEFYYIGKSKKKNSDVCESALLSLI